MNHSPFLFGKIVTGSSFINRREDIKKLSGNFESGINTILISPRRWGKSSLVHKVSDMMSNNKNLKFCFVDMFNVQSEEYFYNLLARQCIKTTSSKLEEWASNAKHFLGKISPKISVSVDDISDIDIQFDVNSGKQSFIDILDLPEKIAAKKKIKIVVCIDEFQNIDRFDDPVGLQQKLRAQWQKHQNVVYCLYGSKRHILMQLFEKKSMPFYRFGEVIYLNKIKKDHFIEFIIKSFRNGNKKISPDIADKITRAVQCHPYYVQQLSHIVWNNCDTATEKIYEKSVNDLIANNLLLYEREFQNLTAPQVRFLHMLSDGVRSNFTSSDLINKYGMKSSSNIIRVIKALENKEIIDRMTGTIEFTDPVFELWLKQIL